MNESKTRRRRRRPRALSMTKRLDGTFPFLIAFLEFPPASRLCFAASGPDSPRFICSRGGFAKPASPRLSLAPPVAVGWSWDSKFQTRRTLTDCTKVVRPWGGRGRRINQVGGHSCAAIGAASALGSLGAARPSIRKDPPADQIRVSPAASIFAGARICMAQAKLGMKTVWPPFAFSLRLPPFYFLGV